MYMIHENGKGKKLLSIFLSLALVLTTALSAAVTVNAATVKPTAISLECNSPNSIVDLKGKISISVKSVKPSNASKTVVWKSADKKIATVSSKGVITGVKAGTVRITATSTANKKVTKSLKIQVKNIKPSSLTLNQSAVTLYAGGKTASLKATVNPVGVYNQGVTFSSSNAKIASVSSSGVITPKAAGSAEIKATTKENGKTKQCKVTVKPQPKDEVLMPFTLVGFYTKDKLNYVPIASSAKVVLWDATAKAFKDAANNKETILGNYVQMTDTNGDKKADLLEVVALEDGKDKWNASMTWLDGAGKDAEPSVSDETGKAMFGAEYRIPMGERLLSGFGLGDYSGTTDFSNLKDSTYWEDYDYYNTTSSDTLTMLTGYKTQLQTTGWTCVLSSALSALDWYGLRGDLNEEDLAALRSDTRSKFAGATTLKELETVFTKLEELGITGKWNMKSSFDDPEKIYDSEWMQSELKAGHPIMVIWNSYGGHGQVIVGYDNMGTKGTADDTLILMDPYDTTDHNADGYTVQSYERLIYGLSGETTDEIGETRYLVAYPEGWTYEGQKMGAGLPDDPSNTIKSKDENKLNSKLYEQTAKDIKRWYKDTDPTWIGPMNDQGVAGPAGIERTGDYNNSPYYNFYDFYNGDSPTKTLDILKNYKTIQQSTEWTCGCTSSVMAAEWFDKNKGNETDISFSRARQNGEAGPTYLSGMTEIFKKLNGTYDQDWTWFTRNDMTDPDGEESYLGDYCLQAGPEDKGLIPYLIKNDIPVMIGWDEWGGHWQTIVGYDDMGTTPTQDDVLILADSYDTTDHDQDGYVIESFERLVFGWNSQFETYEQGGGFDYNNFIVAFPKSEHPEVVKELGLK